LTAEIIASNELLLATTKHKSLGKGLGLYIVYYLIKESFGGDVKIFNDEFEYKNKKNKGLNFEIILPIN